VEWPAGALGLMLQRTIRLNQPEWEDVAQSEQTNHITLPIQADTQFFRLMTP
jgi:hypothetical protein